MPFERRLQGQLVFVVQPLGVIANHWSGKQSRQSRPAKKQLILYESLRNGLNQIIFLERLDLKRV